LETNVWWELDQLSHMWHVIFRSYPDDHSVQSMVSLIDPAVHRRLDRIDGHYARGNRNAAVGELVRLRGFIRRLFLRNKITGFRTRAGAQFRFAAGMTTLKTVNFQSPMAICAQVLRVRRALAALVDTSAWRIAAGMSLRQGLLDSWFPAMHLVGEPDEIEPVGARGHSGDGIKPPGRLIVASSAPANAPPPSSASFGELAMAA
jgi:hypothetical protein